MAMGFDRGPQTGLHSHWRPFKGEKRVHAAQNPSTPKHNTHTDTPTHITQHTTYKNALGSLWPRGHELRHLHSLHVLLVEGAPGGLRKRSLGFRPLKLVAWFPLLNKARKGSSSPPENKKGTPPKKKQKKLALEWIGKKIG